MAKDHKKKGRGSHSLAVLPLKWNIELLPWCRKFYTITACPVSVFLKCVGIISLLAEIGREVYIYRSSVQRSIFTRWR